MEVFAQETVLDTSAPAYRDGLGETVKKKPIHVRIIHVKMAESARKLAMSCIRVIVHVDGLATTATKRLIRVRTTHARMEESVQK
jgi:hypothetical protein